jgi:hypothetical protein
VVAAFVGSLIPLITNNRFYYYDDTQAGAFGIWYVIGTKLSAGEWPVFSDSAWGAGNYAAEGQWGIWNPLILLIGWLASRSTNIVVFSTILKIAFLCLLAAGTFLLARSYKAKAEWAAIGGVAVTLTGFTVYIDAASWVTGLMVFSLLPLTWYGLRRMAFNAGNPLLALAAAYVLITVGYVHGTIMLAIVFAGLLVEASLQGSRRGAFRLLLAGLVCGLIALAVYLPGVLTAPVTARTGGIANSGFLTPDLTGLFTAWVPGSLPQVTGWWGGFATVPLLYVAWFLPILSVVDYHKVKLAGRELSGLWFVGLLSLALTLAPSDLGPLRFPIRVMPYVSLAVLLTLSVLVTLQGARAQPWTRDRHCGNSARRTVPRLEPVPVLPRGGDLRGAGSRRHRRTPLSPLPSSTVAPPQRASGFGRGSGAAEHGHCRGTARGLQSVTAA